MTIDFEDAEFTWSHEGPPGAATVEQVGDLEARVAAREAITIPTVITDLTDVSGTPATGDLLQYDGAGWVPYTLPAPTPTKFMIPFILDGSGSTIPLGEWPPRALYIDFEFDVYGYVLDADGAITVDVKSSPEGTPFVSIVGTEKPTLAAAGIVIDKDLTTWTTTISAGNLLVANVDSAAATIVTFTLLCERTA